MASTTRTTGRHRLQLAATVVGGTFLLVGILGFVPGITTDFGDITFAGHESEAKLLGIFEVSILHNIVHLLFGVIGLAAARTIAGSRTYLVGGGVLYLGLWLYGLLIDKASDANFIPVNAADDWLHFGLGTGMVALGLLLADRKLTSSRGGTADRTRTTAGR